MTTDDNTGGDLAGQLLECGHVGQFAGVCQYQGCATRLCPACEAICETCGTVLCRKHQVWLAENRRVFCLPDSRSYLTRKFIRRLFGRT